MSDVAWQTFNINNYVRIRPTDVGRAAYDAWYWNLRMKPQKMKADADGWVRMQLWEVMMIFGDSMGNGAPVPFETEIQIGLPIVGEVE